MAFSGKEYEEQQQQQDDHDDDDKEDERNKEEEEDIEEGDKEESDTSHSSILAAVNPCDSPDLPVTTEELPENPACLLPTLVVKDDHSCILKLVSFEEVELFSQLQDSVNFVTEMYTVSNKKEQAISMEKLLSECADSSILTCSHPMVKLPVFTDVSFQEDEMIKPLRDKLHISEAAANAAFSSDEMCVFRGKLRASILRLLYSRQLNKEAAGSFVKTFQNMLGFFHNIHANPISDKPIGLARTAGRLTQKSYKDVARKVRNQTVLAMMEAKERLSPAVAGHVDEDILQASTDTDEDNILNPVLTEGTSVQRVKLLSSFARLYKANRTRNSTKRSSATAVPSSKSPSSSKTGCTTKNSERAPAAAAAAAAATVSSNKSPFSTSLSAIARSSKTGATRKTTKRAAATATVAVSSSKSRSNKAGGTSKTTKRVAATAAVSSSKSRSSKAGGTSKTTKRVAATATVSSSKSLPSSSPVTSTRSNRPGNGSKRSSSSSIPSVPPAKKTRK